MKKNLCFITLFMFMLSSITPVSIANGGTDIKEKVRTITNNAREIRVEAKEARNELKEEIKRSREEAKDELKDLREGLKDSVHNSVYSSVSGDVYSQKDELKQLRDQLIKIKKASKDQKREIMRKIVSLRKAKNDNTLPVFINGKDLKFPVPPVIKEGTTLIPVRAVSNALNADVAWDGATHTVTVTKSVSSEVYGTKTTVIVIKLDSRIVTVNGVEQELAIPAQTINNSTMVPLRFLASVLGKKVDWDKESGSVIIDDENTPEESDSQSPSDDTATPIEGSDSVTPTPTPGESDSESPSDGTVTPIEGSDSVAPTPTPEATDSETIAPVENSSEILPAPSEDIIN